MIRVRRPHTASLPHSELCGPRTISMRSMLPVLRVFPAKLVAGGRVIGANAVDQYEDMVRFGASHPDLRLRARDTPVVTDGKAGNGAQQIRRHCEPRGARSASRVITAGKALPSLVDRQRGAGACDDDLVDVIPASRSGREGGLAERKCAGLRVIRGESLMSFMSFSRRRPRTGVFGRPWRGARENEIPVNRPPRSNCGLSTGRSPDS